MVVDPASVARGTLNELITALRHSPASEEQILAASTQSISYAFKHGSKKERADAALKIVYLRMLGIDCSDKNAAGILEVMSYQPQILQRTGYLACSVCITDRTPIVLLAVNLLRKALLNGADSAGICLALSTMASMATPDISSALQSEILQLLSSAKPPIRARAAAGILRLAKGCPSIIESALPQLKQLLVSDEDSSVKTAVSGVMLELVARDPASHTKLAPKIYGLIEARKLSNFATLKCWSMLRLLCPHESRLAPKLIPLIARQLQEPDLCLSLLCEIIRLTMECLPANLEVSQMGLQSLKDRLWVPDVNLKAAALRLLSSALDRQLGWPTAIQTFLTPDLLAELSNVISSHDSLMRAAALRLLKHSVTADTFSTVSTSLLEAFDTKHGASDELTSEVINDYVRTLLELASTDNFCFVRNDVTRWMKTLVIIAMRPDLETSTVDMVQNQILDLMEDSTHGGTDRDKNTTGSKKPDAIMKKSGQFLLRSLTLCFIANYLWVDAGGTPIDHMISRPDMVAFAAGVYMRRWRDLLNLPYCSSEEASVVEELLSELVQQQQRADERRLHQANTALCGNGQQLCQELQAAVTHLTEKANGFNPETQAALYTLSFLLYAGSEVTPGLSDSGSIAFKLQQNASAHLRLCGRVLAVAVASDNSTSGKNNAFSTLSNHGSRARAANTFAPVDSDLWTAPFGASISQLASSAGTVAAA